ncbi:hypothetical protein JHK87_049363 [Glycine soja]|nr:hypothetical protein JHK87_049363 [Glycine soja]
MPEEISKLTKLRHLLSYFTGLIQWKDIGGMTSLQEIPPVIIDDDGVVIREVGKLKQLRELSVVYFRGRHEKTLCSIINEMPLLEKLRIDTADESEVIDLYITSPMSTPRKLLLRGTLTRLPNWISQFPNLVQLYLDRSRLIDDALKSLKNMPRLLFLFLSDNAYEGETLSSALLLMEDKITGSSKMCPMYVFGVRMLKNLCIYSAEAITKMRPTLKIEAPEMVDKCI